MRHFAFHTLQRLIKFESPENPLLDMAVDVDGAWTKAVWPVVQRLHARRFLEEGKACYARPAVRPRLMGDHKTFRIDIELFYHEDPNTFAFTESQIQELSQRAFAVFWPNVPIAWRRVSQKDFESVLGKVLEVFPSYRLDCRLGPMNKVILDVPWEQKEQAKYHFARWDPYGQVWYAFEYQMNRALEPFLKR